MKSPKRRVCFVIMGFGKKTDFETGRTLDLDATYDAIIKPAVEAQNLRCVRADEIVHAGMIDTKMYQMLLQADLVIADISTGNVNAVYELGVRHALRPNATIIMKESGGRFSFDLNHTSTFQYEHLCSDIGAREAERAKSALQVLISNAIISTQPDSPVYTYLPQLKHPHLTDTQFSELLDQTEEYEDDLVRRLRAGSKAIKESSFEIAVAELSAAHAIKPEDPFIIQQLTLATYKSGKPSPVTSLTAAWAILNRLDPKHSNDPETLGLAGAINKRLWLLTQDRAVIDQAIY